MLTFQISYDAEVRIVKKNKGGLGIKDYANPDLVLNSPFDSLPYMLQGKLEGDESRTTWGTFRPPHQFNNLHFKQFQFTVNKRWTYSLNAAYYARKNDNRQSSDKEQ